MTPIDVATQKLGCEIASGGLPMNRYPGALCEVTGLFARRAPEAFYRPGGRAGARLSPAHRLVIHGALEGVVAALLEASPEAYLRHESDPGNASLLAEALRAGSGVNMLVRLTEALGAQAGRVSRRTPGLIGYAVAQGRVDGVVRMLAAGVRVDEPGGSGVPPALALALRALERSPTQARASVVHLLVGAGADVHAMDAVSAMSVEQIAERMAAARDEGPVSSAVESVRAAARKRRLQARGSGGEGQTPPWPDTGPGL